MSQEKHAHSKDMSRPLLGSAARSDQPRRTPAEPSGLPAARGMATYLLNEPEAEPEVKWPGDGLCQDK